MQRISLGPLTVNVYDGFVLIIALVLFGIFIDTAIKETRRLVALAK